MKKLLFILISSLATIGLTAQDKPTGITNSYVDSGAKPASHNGGFEALRGTAVLQNNGLASISYCNVDMHPKSLRLNSFLQDQPYSKEYYLHKSKNQRTIAWVMFIGGTAFFLAGTYIAVDNLYGEPTTAGPVLFWTGTASMLGSIPFFISAGKNKRKAASITFINEKIWMPQQGALVGKMQQGISLKLSL